MMKSRSLAIYKIQDSLPLLNFKHSVTEAIMAGVSPFLNLPLDLFRYVLDSFPANLKVAEVLKLRQLNSGSSRFT